MQFRSLIIAAAVAAGSVAGAVPASATGTLAECAGVEYFADGSFTISNPAGTVACVTTRHTPSGAASYVGSDVAAGWTTRVKSNGGATNRSKIEVEFRKTATGATCSYMIRLGEVRGNGDCQA